MLINHVSLLLDGSQSMDRVAKQVVEMTNNQIKFHEQKSKEVDQETRVSLYVFEDSRSPLKCHAYDRDVMRLPSLTGLYRAVGQNTPLIKSTLQVIREQQRIPTMYDDHAFLIMVLTDGEENTGGPARDLQAVLRSLPDNWTVGTLVPGVREKANAKACGFQDGNVQIWDMVATAEKELVTSTTNFYQARAAGKRGTANLFAMNVDALKKKDLKGTKKLGPGQFDMFKASADTPIREFVEAKMKRKYVLGEAYYELIKREKVQAQKEIALYSKKEHAVYTGAKARELLSLPPYEVKVGPEQHPDFKVFIQSTSVNRKVMQDQSILILA